MDCVDDVTQGGHFLDSAPQLSTDAATTLRVSDNKALITDGPFAETKEQLAGFYMLEARDINEAIRLAEKIPPARYGCVEIRPVRELIEQGNSRSLRMKPPGQPRRSAALHLSNAAYVTPQI